MSAKKATLKEAVTWMVRGQYDYRTYQHMERVIINAGFCPICACDGRKGRLGKYQPGDSESYGGWECTTCGEWVSDENRQPAYEMAGAPDVDAAGRCYSDADPGL